MNLRPERRAGAALGLILCVGFADASGAENPDPPCRAAMELSATSAVVGQQVIQRVRVLRGDGVADANWIAPPRVEEFRVESLPGRSIEEPQVLAGRSYRVHEERRALFPERSGRHRIAAGHLRCLLRRAGKEHTFEVPIPPAVLEVSLPPASGRPANWVGIVGPVSIQTLVTPSEVSLGETVRVAYMLRGGNVWRARAPIDTLATADVFARRPELTLEKGETLTAVQHFAYDVVPLEPGELVVPEVRVAYFDPTAARYAEATGDSLRIRVGPRVPVGRDAANLADRDREARAAPAPTSEPARPGAAWWLLAAAVIAGVGLASHRFQRVRASRGALAALGLGVGAGEGTGAAYARALRASLARRLPEVGNLSAEEIAAHPNLSAPAADAARLLLEVERARFDPTAALPTRETVERVLAEL